MEKYGLIGFPLGHSFSISYFNQKFQDEDIDAVYENFEIPTIDELPEVIDSNPNLKGLNVTIPYKEKVIPFLDSISPEARAIGAVNVIRVTHEGKKIKLKGYNSDVIGFTKSIEPMLDKKHSFWARAVHRRLLTTDCVTWGWRLYLSAAMNDRVPFSIRASRLKSSRNTMSLSIVPHLACTPRRKNVPCCPTRRWTLTRFSTISFTIRTRHFS